MNPDQGRLGDHESKFYPSAPLTNYNFFQTHPAAILLFMPIYLSRVYAIPKTKREKEREVAAYQSKQPAR